MIRNRNGYWMSPSFNALYAPDGGDGGAGDGMAVSSDAISADAVNSPTDGAETAVNAGASDQADDSSSDDLHAEIARLKAEAAKNKTALDKATKEAGDLRKELRSKMTQEQIDAENKKEAEEKAAKELDELRREVAKGKTVKSVMGKLGLDEDSAGNLADHLYGAADIDNALLEIQKAWQSKEKALRVEFGKITGPGAGADSNSPEAQAVKRAAEFGKARSAQNEQAQKAMNAYMR